MCQCNPMLRTPYCGKGDCNPPNDSTNMEVTLVEKSLILAIRDLNVSIPAIMNYIRKQANNHN